MHNQLEMPYPPVQETMQTFQKGRRDVIASDSRASIAGESCLTTQYI